MNPRNRSGLRDSVRAYCASIGADSLLVQGAGGNASWKDEDILWVKASGTWLADAQRNDIFVPVDLALLNRAIEEQNYGVTPVVRGVSKMRPSIETLLHALMPQRVVVHLHAVDVLAHLVRADFCDHILDTQVDGVIGVWLPYRKPGAALAASVHEALEKKPSANVVFLQNHGIVAGADSVDDLDAILHALVEAFRVTPYTSTFNIAQKIANISISDLTWKPLADPQIHELATNPTLFERLDSNWALYPDHVVFLGPHAVTLANEAELVTLSRADTYPPEIVFIQGKGVFTSGELSTGAQTQIRCYYDVLVRQQPGTKLTVLSESEICELLNWDAERYRIQIAK